MQASLPVDNNGGSSGAREISGNVMVGQEASVY